MNLSAAYIRHIRLHDMTQSVFAQTFSNDVLQVSWKWTNSQNDNFKGSPSADEVPDLGLAILSRSWLYQFWQVSLLKIYNSGYTSS